jgi:hypothetical protein
LWTKQGLKLYLMTKQYLFNVIANYWGINDRYRVMAQYTLLGTTETTRII